MPKIYHIGTIQVIDQNDDGRYDSGDSIYETGSGRVLFLETLSGTALQGTAELEAKLKKELGVETLEGVALGAAGHFIDIKEGYLNHGPSTFLSADDLMGHCKQAEVLAKAYGFRFDAKEEFRSHFNQWVEWNSPKVLYRWSFLNERVLRDGGRLHPDELKRSILKTPEQLKQRHRELGLNTINFRVRGRLESTVSLITGLEKYIQYLDNPHEASDLLKKSYQFGLELLLVDSFSSGLQHAEIISSYAQKLGRSIDLKKIEAFQQAEPESLEAYLLAADIFAEIGEFEFCDIMLARAKNVSGLNPPKEVEARIEEIRSLALVREASPLHRAIAPSVETATPMATFQRGLHLSFGHETPFADLVPGVTTHKIDPVSDHIPHKRSLYKLGPLFIDDSNHDGRFDENDTLYLDFTLQKGLGKSAPERRALEKALGVSSLNGVNLEAAQKFLSLKSQIQKVLPFDSDIAFETIAESIQDLCELADAGGFAFSEADADDLRLECFSLWSETQLNKAAELARREIQEEQPTMRPIKGPEKSFTDQALALIHNVEATVKKWGFDFESGRAQGIRVGILRKSFDALLKTYLDNPFSKKTDARGTITYILNDGTCRQVLRLAAAIKDPALAPLLGELNDLYGLAQVVQLYAKASDELKALHAHKGGKVSLLLSDPMEPARKAAKSMGMTLEEALQQFEWKRAEVAALSGDLRRCLVFLSNAEGIVGPFLKTGEVEAMKRRAAQRAAILLKENLQQAAQNGETMKVEALYASSAFNDLTSWGGRIDLVKRLQEQRNVYLETAKQEAQKKGAFQSHETLARLVLKGDVNAFREALKDHSQTLSAPSRAPQPSPQEKRILRYFNEWLALVLSNQENASGGYFLKIIEARREIEASWTPHIMSEVDLLDTMAKHWGRRTVFKLIDENQVALERLEFGKMRTRMRNFPFRPRGLQDTSEEMKFLMEGYWKRSIRIGK